MFAIDTPSIVASLVGASGSVVEMTITHRDLSDYAEMARNGHLSVGLTGVSFRDIATGEESPVYVLDYGYCAHSHTAITTHGDVICEFCSEFRRHVTAEEYRGMVE